MVSSSFLCRGLNCGFLTKRQREQDELEGSLWATAMRVSTSQGRFHSLYWLRCFSRGCCFLLYYVVLSWLGLLRSGLRYGFLWCGLGCSFLMFLCGSCCGSRLFCFNCGFVSAVVLCGVVWARVFFSFLPYCIALGFIIVAGCGFVLAESSYSCVVCHPRFL